MRDLAIPGGLEARVATAADVEAITGLIAACERADDGAVEIDASDVAQFLASTTGPMDALVVVGTGCVVAWGALNSGRAYVDVHPDRRARGIGQALQRWSEGRARRHGRGRIRQTVTDNDRAAVALFTAGGYAPAHTSWILEKPLKEHPPTLVVPDGITIRPYRLDDARAVHRVVEAAFSEWPDREPVGFDDWAEHVLIHSAFSAELSRLAFDGDELVGAALALDYAAADDGWVQQLATKATHRHRGIARALIGSVFVAFHERGRRMVGLSTDSRTGALTLYERLGMRIRRSYTGWAKDLT